MIYKIQFNVLLHFEMFDESDGVTWFQKLCINILKVGQIPQHVAFIMDGNRRFAKKNSMESKFGHSMGFEVLSRTWRLCRELGITEVTVYAFSIENFKRSHEEVQAILDLAKEKFLLLLNEKEKIMRDGICFRVFGKLSLLPADIQKIIAELMLMTKDNKKCFLNFAIAYTSREEVVNAISTVVDGIHSGLIEEDDIDEELLSNCLYITRKRGPDLLLRTSGETRISDFLLCQLNHSYIYFLNDLWPEFNIWKLLALVFLYQRKSIKMAPESPAPSTNRSQKFLESVEASRWLLLQQYASYNS